MPQTLSVGMLNAGCPVMHVWFMMPFCAICLAMYADLAILARVFCRCVLCVRVGAPDAFSLYGIRVP